MGDIYRKCRLVQHNLSEPQKIDPLGQGHEHLKILQKVKRLRRLFILTEDEFEFFSVNEHRKLSLPPDSDVPEVARQLVNTPKVTIVCFGIQLGCT
jgi:hypothetical protein